MGLAEFFFGEYCKRCRKNRTKEVFESLLTCDDCKEEIMLERDLEAIIREEGVRKCVVDGTDMKKVKIGEIFIDKCPKCRGVWLDGGEIDRLEKKFNAEGHEEGESSGFTNGLVMGMLLD